MRGVVGGLLVGQSAVSAEVPHMNVRIENSQGKIEGLVRVTRPITANIGINCVLGNDIQPSRLRLVDLKINKEAAFLAKAALKAIDIEGKAREALSDPRVALFNVLKPQFKQRGVKITGFGLHFVENVLKIDLNGEPL